MDKVRRFEAQPKTAVGKKRFQALKYIWKSPTGCRKGSEINRVLRTTPQTCLTHLHWLAEKGFIRRLDRLTWGIAIEMTPEFDVYALDAKED